MPFFLAQSPTRAGADKKAKGHDQGNWEAGVGRLEREKDSG